MYYITFLIKGKQLVLVQDICFKRRGGFIRIYAGTRFR